MPRRYTPLGGFFIPDSTVSSGTLRTQDLLRAFADEYERLLPFNSREACYEARGAADAFDNEVHVIMENADYVLEQLTEALDEIAGTFNCYFGTAPGDGACFGFWQLEEEEDVL